MFVNEINQAADTDIPGRGSEWCPAGCKLVPDNVYDTLDLYSVEIPEGYERDGYTVSAWFREPQAGESFVGVAQNVIKNKERLGVVLSNLFCTDYRRIILRPIAPKTKRVFVLEVDAPAKYPSLFTVTVNGENVNINLIKGEERPI
jgi:hypothetical protein